MATKTVHQNRKRQVNAEIVNVTPQIAAKWIELNGKNRPLRMSTVTQYARDMAAGAWLVTGEAVKFDTGGNLIDGQHRLHAVVQSGAAVPLIVIRGVAPDAQTVMDSGAKRTASDALSLAGHKHTALTAAATTLAINYTIGNLRDAHQPSGSLLRPTHTEIIEFVEANPDIEEASTLTQNRWLRITQRGSVTAFCAWACLRIDAPQAMAFFDDLAEMRTDGVGDPRQALLSRFRSIIEMRQRVGQVEQADAFFRAWNAVRAGQRLSRINPRNVAGNFTVPR